LITRGNDRPYHGTASRSEQDDVGAAGDEFCNFGMVIDVGVAEADFATGSFEEDGQTC